MTDERIAALKRLAQQKNYGRGPKHAERVRRLSAEIYEGLTATGMLRAVEEERRLLETAALLHDIGLPKEPHNEAAFDFLLDAIPEVTASNPLSTDEMTLILYCVLWHRGDIFETRGGIVIMDLRRARKIASVLRVADALDRTLRQLVEHVQLNTDGRRLSFAVFSNYSIGIELCRAKQKADLMKQAFTLMEVRFEHAGA